MASPSGTENLPRAIEERVEQIREALAIDSPELIDELHSIALEQVRTLAARQARLDAKATSLTSVSGVSLTLTLTCGGLLLTKSELFEWWVVVPYALAMAAGLVAAVQATRVLLVRASREVSEDHVFSSEVLRDVDPEEHHFSRYADPEGKDIAKARVNGRARFRAYMVPHYWSISLAARQRHESSARHLKLGQASFILFLVFLLLTCLTGGISVILSRDGKSQTTSQGHSTKDDSRFVEDGSTADAGGPATSAGQTFGSAAPATSSHQEVTGL